ncbi:MAG: antitoxin MazE-like protein [Reyranella sp.]|uniref:antitoxin MazE-like protein n=1 Tax=Reyranella sp. TaxID=1929291 RepID=UPI003D0EB217
MKGKASSHRASARRYRERMRSEGLRQVSLWVYDRSSPAFVRECRRQSLLISKVDAAADIERLLDESLREIYGWTA